MNSENSELKDSSKLAWSLALGGAIPFATLALAMFFLGKEHGLFTVIFDAFKAWSAIILSFVAGARWGLAIAQNPIDKNALLISVVPAIVAWLAQFLDDPQAVLVLLVAYCAQGAWDSFGANAKKLPQWFGTLRIRMTFLIAAIHILVFLALW